MKKTFKYTAIISVVVFLFSAGALTLFKTNHYLKGEKILEYNRFHTIKNGKREFNMWGLISPLQVESQKKIYGTINFSRTVMYPVAPVFKVIAPSDSIAEAKVAAEIAKAVADTINKIRFDLSFDYDGQSMAVRQAQQPEEPHTLPKPKVFLSLFGTASPEAIKYGFRESIKPGHIETENTELAKERLARTTTWLLHDLHSYGVDSVSIVSSSSKELQFSETDEVDSTTAVEMLPGMRYVRATITIPTQRMVVTPLTAPISLPIALLTLSLVWLLSLYLFPENETAGVEEIEESTAVTESYWSNKPVTPTGMNRYDGVLLLLFVVFCFVGYFLWKYILGLACVAGFLYCLYRVLNALYELYKTFEVSESLNQKRIYWAKKPWTCKFVVGWFIATSLLGIFALVTYILGYWHICF